MITEKIREQLEIFLWLGAIFFWLWEANCKMFNLVMLLDGFFLSYIWFITQFERDPAAQAHMLQRHIHPDVHE